MNPYLERIQGFGALTHRGGTKQTVVRDDRDGAVVGTQTEHWDDHVDATAKPKPVRLTAKRVMSR